jgi:hypothetical protein
MICCLADIVEWVKLRFVVVTDSSLPDPTVALEAAIIAPLARTASGTCNSCRIGPLEQLPT